MRMRAITAAGVLALDRFDPYADYGRDDLLDWLAGYEPESLRKQYRHQVGAKAAPRIE